MQNKQPQYPVPWRIVEYVDVAARARELGCRAPSGIALLPGNFDTAASAADFLFPEVAAQVRSAWRSIGLVDTGPYRRGHDPIVPNWDRVPSRDLAHSEGQEVPLTVFFGADLLRFPARPVLHAIGIVASVFLNDPGSVDARETRFNAVVERPGDRGYVCLEYDGDACELVALAKSVIAIWDDDTQRPTTVAHNGVGNFTWPLCHDFRSDKVCTAATNHEPAVMQAGGAIRELPERSFSQDREE
jgi:hypothetical protein